MGNIGNVAFNQNVEVKVGNKPSDTKPYTGFGSVQSKMCSSDSDKAVVAGQQKLSMDFGSILSSMVNIKPDAPISSLQTEENHLSQAEMKELISFLNMQDVMDVENGMEVLNQLLTEVDIVPKELAKDLLKLSDKEISSILDELQPILEEHTWKENDKTKLLDNMDDLVALLTSIQSLPDPEFKKIVDQDFAKLIKFIKLDDILTSNQESVGQNKVITKLLESITNKLEQLIKPAPVNFKTDYLQNTFTLLSRDLNKNSPPGKQTEGLDLNPSLTHPMTKAEQLTIMLGDTRRPVTTEQFIQQFENILAKSQFSKTDGMQKLLLKLAPEHLGSLRIELIQKDQMLVAKILTTTGAAKESLESHLNGLKQALANQNIQVERIEISQQMSTQERSLHRDPQHQERRQEEPKQEQEKNDSKDEFNESLLEALVNVEV